MIKTDIKLPIRYSGDDIVAAVCASLPVSADELSDIRIVKRTLSVTDPADPHYRTTVAMELDPEREAGLLKMRKKVFAYEPFRYIAPSSELDHRPVVVGAGPAGIFAALTLAEAGARPIVIERGMPVEERKKCVDRFNLTGVLDPESNVQFGEGGAGAFSDGKLKCGAKDKYKVKILEEFVGAGADESILYSSSAHLGTDKLPSIICNLRRKIIALGGEFIFSARLVRLGVSDGKLESVTFFKDGVEETLETRSVILAIGHSAEDTLRMLYSLGLPMSSKGFGIGARIEHRREYINKIVYKEACHSIDETASYHLVTHLPSGRSVYSFCMCPGGTVVAAASNEGGIVTNGMSEYARMAENSNSAILVSLTPADFGSEHPLAGIELQRRIEWQAFSVCGDYRAPVEDLGSFLGGGECRSSVAPSYPRGTVRHPLDTVLPSFVTEAMAEAFSDFGAWLPGFSTPEAVLTAPETRSTSPVRIERDGQGRAYGFSGIYPAGEGAGYSGGILSSASDGMHAAESLLLTK